jgi:hypothetical protein
MHRAGRGVGGRAYPLLLRRRCLAWGATRDEVTRPLPGDDLLATPDMVSTRAITIDAPPSAIWPWLVQMAATGEAPRSPKPHRHTQYVGCQTRVQRRADGAGQPGDGAKDAQRHQAESGGARSPAHRRRRRRMKAAAGRAAVDLYWLPLGAGGHCVRANGRAFEALAARLQHRRRPTSTTLPSRCTSRPRDAS